MKRVLALAEHAAGALWRRRGKSGALASGLALVVAMLAAVVMTTQSLRAESERGLERAPDLVVQRLEAGRPALIEEAWATRIAELPAVRRVRPRVFGYYFFTALEGNLTLLGVESDDALQGALAEGRAPRAPGEVVIGAALERGLGLRVGDELGLPVRGEMRFSRVVGRFAPESEMRSADVVAGTPEHIRTLLGMPEGMASDLLVDLTTPDEASVITARVDEMFPGARVLDRERLGRTYALTFETRGGVLSAALLPALIAFLLLAWERLTGLGADERLEVGVLKAVGWSTSDVLVVRGLESLILALVGATLGLVSAYAYVFWFRAPGLADVLLGWSAVRPSFALTPTLELADVIALLAAVVGPYVAVALVPAWRAASLDPDEAMRGGR